MSAQQGTPTLLLEPSNNLAMYQVAWTDSYDDILSSPYLHRFTALSGAKCDKNELLTLVMRMSANEAVVPFKYKLDGEHAVFFMFECGQLIKELCGANLTLHLPVSKITVKFIISLKFTPLSDEPMIIDKCIFNAFSKRAVKVKDWYTLDLSAFHRDSEFSETFYFPLCNQNCAIKCNQVLRRLHISIHSVDLKNNGLTSTRIVEMFNRRVLKVVDLRSNSLEWDAIAHLHGHPLSEIYLEGNPLCAKFQTSQDFVQSLKGLFPALTKVDGHDITTCNFGLVHFKNFFVNPGLAQFTDHFLHHYFKLYESNSRESLSDMYHPNAQLTISTHPFQEGVFNNRFNEVILRSSRNIFQIADIKKAGLKVKKGPEEIMELLNMLPCVEFDPTSFTVDVPYYEDKKIVMINVTGLFREYPIPTISIHFYFDRTFLLVPGKDVRGEWKILNDMLLLTHPSQAQIQSFKSEPKPPPDPEIAIFLSDYSVPKTQLIRLFKKYTELSQQYSQKFLSESKWDLEKAFQNFTDQLKGNHLPPEAFQDQKN